MLVQGKAVIRVHQAVNPAEAVTVGANPATVIGAPAAVVINRGVMAAADIAEVIAAAEEAEVLAVEAEVDFMEPAVEADLVVEAVTGAVEAEADAVKKIFVSERNPVYRVPFFYIPACANFCKNN